MKRTVLISACLAVIGFGAGGMAMADKDVKPGGKEMCREMMGGEMGVKRIERTATKEKDHMAMMTTDMPKECMDMCRQMMNGHAGMDKDQMQMSRKEMPKKCSRMMEMHGMNRQ